MREILGMLSIVLGLCIGREASGETWYVAPSGSDTNPGTKARPFATIQRGIDAAAADGDTVIVAEGTYTENLLFGAWDITLRSTNPLNSSVVENTIIDGGASGPCVTLTSAQGQETVLAGFTITNGSADCGGGIYGEGEPRTTATIEHNVIELNYAGDGGGLSDCDGTIRSNRITMNAATSFGGGLCECSGIVENNAIAFNISDDSGGGLAFCDGVIRGNAISTNTTYTVGGGLDKCSGTILGNTISHNFAAMSGGGLYECGIVEGNFIYSNVSSLTGGGLAHFTSGRIRSNLICGNSTGRLGGAMHGCAGLILNNTIVGNSAEMAGGGLSYCDGMIVNCIMWGNMAPEDEQLDHCSDPSYCCIQGWSGAGEHNTTDPPLFANPLGGDGDPDTYDDNDYHVLSSSPCIDMGDDSVLDPPGLDADGNLRIALGRPYGTDPVADMGAYEYNSRPFRVIEIGGLTAVPTWVPITWTSQPNDTYAVLSCNDLTRGLWVGRAKVASHGDTTRWTDQGPFGSMRFYRVQMLIE
jgi:hypothetical protein